MSTSEIIASLPKLTPEEREAVRSRLDEIDAAESPTAEEKRLIDERVATYRRNPDAVCEWRAAEREIRDQLGM